MYGVDGVFALQASVPAENWQKTLLWYVAWTEKYVKRIIYFPFSELCKLKNRKKCLLFTAKIYLNVFAIKNGVFRSCTFRFFSGVFELPTVLFSTLLI